MSHEDHLRRPLEPPQVSEKLKHRYLERTAAAKREADLHAVSPLEKARLALGGQNPSDEDASPENASEGVIDPLEPDPRLEFRIEDSGRAVFVDRATPPYGVAGQTTIEQMIKLQDDVNREDAEKLRESPIPHAGLSAEVATSWEGQPDAVEVLAEAKRSLEHARNSEGVDSGRLRGEGPLVKWTICTGTDDQPHGKFQYVEVEGCPLCRVIKTTAASSNPMWVICTGTDEAPHEAYQHQRTVLCPRCSPSCICDGPGHARTGTEHRLICPARPDCCCGREGCKTDHRLRSLEVAQQAALSQAVLNRPVSQEAVSEDRQEDIAQLASQAGYDLEDWQIELVARLIAQMEDRAFAMNAGRDSLREVVDMLSLAVDPAVGADPPGTP